MIEEFNLAFLEWRGDKEAVKLGVAYPQERQRAKNWKFRDYYKWAKRYIKSSQNMRKVSK